MRRIFVPLLLLLAGTACAQAPRKSGIHYDHWPTQAHDARNTFSTVASLRTLDLVYQHSYLGVGWPQDPLLQPTNIDIAADGSLWIATELSNKVSHVDPISFYQRMSYNLGRDATGRLNYQIFTWGGKRGLVSSNDGLEIYRFNDDDSIFSYAMPWGVDYWGPTIFDEATGRLYSVQQSSWDNPDGIMLFCAEPFAAGGAKKLWAFNHVAGTRKGINDANGGLAFYAGKVVFAPRYEYWATFTGTKLESGLYCLDTDGHLLWHQQGEPIGPPTICSGLVYIVEKMPTATRVICRRLADGSLVWKDETGAALPSVYEPAEILTFNGRVVAVVGKEIRCYNYSTGQRLWSYPFDPVKCQAVRCYMVGLLFSETIALMQRPDLLLINAKTGALVSKAPLNGYPTAMAASGDRIYTVAYTPGSSATQVGVFEDRTWIADGVPPTLLHGPPAFGVPKLGANVTRSAYIEGTAPLALQWCWDGVPIPGATEAVYTFTATADLAGKALSCTAVNRYGKLVTKPVVLPAPSS